MKLSNRAISNILVPFVATGIAFCVVVIPVAMMEKADTPTPSPTVTQTPTPTPHAKALTPDPSMFLDKLQGKKKLDGEELSMLLAGVGFKGQAHKIAWALAMRESTGRPTAHRVVAATADNSYGLFQINMRGYLGVDRRKVYGLSSDSQLLDPVVNATVTWKMSKKGTDFGPWGIGPNAYRTNRGIDTISSHFGSYPGYPALTTGKIGTITVYYVHFKK